MWKREIVRLICLFTFLLVCVLGFNRFLVAHSLLFLLTLGFIVSVL